MTLLETASKINHVLTASPVFVQCISMHEYSICLELYALSVQIVTEVEIVWDDGTKVLVSADYRHRAEPSFSILKLIGGRVLSCRFDETKSLLFQMSGGESVRCIAVDPVESYVVQGTTDTPLFLP